MLEELQDSPLLKSLPQELIEEILSFCKIKRFVKDEVLFYENDEVKNIYYILQGSVKFYKVDRFDNEIFLYKLSKNSLIFDLSKLCEEYILQCFANAEFLEDSKILAIEAKKFKALMKTNQNLMRRIMKESFLMIQQMQCIISRDIVFDGTAKVAHMIDNDLKDFNSLKKHEIAYMLHMQPETLSRILKKLTRIGVIVMQNNQVFIQKPEELREIYN
ncbi:MAG: Crp/Fnr family transcriptional regulator [Epsilonproteobacteria bacterium]|nr:Crp/Fnr family transcriptional regulator [Campylobacterota bacterium]